MSEYEYVERECAECGEGIVLEKEVAKQMDKSDGRLWHGECTPEEYRLKDET